MKTLFDETRIGQMTMKNRLIRAAMADPTQDGSVDDRIIETYAGFAKMGVGAIVTGYTLVAPEERLLPVVSLFSDEDIPGHKKIAQAAHDGGANILCQLAYIGSYTPGGWNTGGPVTVAPSSVANHLTGTPAREMRLKEIKNLQIKFADAAIRAKQAGYDGVEINAAHGYLLSQFLTPYYNRRTDSYGGPIRNRAKMILETYETVRDTVGKNFPIWVKINSTDNMEGGITPDDCRYVCRQLTELGVDAIEVSGNWATMAMRDDVYFLDAATVIAGENDVAVILTGGNRNADIMTKILNETKIAYFGIARPFQKDPDFVKRLEK